MEASEKDCPDEVIEHVRSVDLTDEENSELFSWISENAPLECQVHCVGEVADRLHNGSHPDVISDFCASAATYAKLLEPEVKEKVSIPDVLAELGIAEQFRQHGTTLVGQCPLPSHAHGPHPNHQQFKINCKGGVWLWHCFGD